MTLLPGQPYPLGAEYTVAGTNFAIFASNASLVELSLFDTEGRETRFELSNGTGFVWHGYLPNILPGQRYGYRIHGPWALDLGHRHDPSKLLLDPYAKAIDGQVRWDDAIFSQGTSLLEDTRIPADSAPFVPRSVVVDTQFDWGEVDHPNTPLNETVIYEAHVKGLTYTHPDVPNEIRGTYAGLAHPAIVDHLKALGVTAIELLPVHQFAHRRELVRRDLKNYWGYDSLGFFAPHNEYSSSGQAGQQVHEFKQMVKTLHQTGIEVLLDVVYNHTVEGPYFGPTLSFRGIDNAAYYYLDPDDSRLHLDPTGTGNTLNTSHPQMLQLTMDSLRYWVSEMHVDGFRFDLAATLARNVYGEDEDTSFFDVIQQDPVIGQVKLFAEPWEIGAGGGYRVGKFPPGWSEWNGKYRDTVRNFWRGNGDVLGDFASYFTGGSHLFGGSGRGPLASLNYVTAHDGLTLHDLVSYNEKHNLANGQHNEDGDSDNISWNCGVEGPTDDPAINNLRARQKRNLMATVLLSQGVPMLLGGDEIGRTQGGNNNPYCHDSEVSWYDWSSVDGSLLDFFRRIVKIRADHPVFRRRDWFDGEADGEPGMPDIGWFTNDGAEMTSGDWEGGSKHSLAVFINGQGIPGLDAQGERIVDDSFYLMLNADHEKRTFVIPTAKWGRQWVIDLDTADDAAHENGHTFAAGDQWLVEARSLVLLRSVK